VLKADKALGEGLRIDDMDAVSVRFRQGGERIKLPERGTHTLKNLFHEWNVLPWERDRVPLIFINDELAAVVGFAVADHFLAREDEEGFVVTMGVKGDLGT